MVGNGGCGEDRGQPCYTDDLSRLASQETLAPPTRNTMMILVSVKYVTDDGRSHSDANHSKEKQKQKDENVEEEKEDTVMKDA